MSGIISTQASWGQVFQAVGQVAPELAMATGQVAQFAATPQGVFLIASLIVRQRAKNAGKSIQQLLKDDVNDVYLKATDKAKQMIEYVEAQQAAAETAARKKNLADLLAKLSENLPKKPVEVESQPPAEGGRHRRTLRKRKRRSTRRRMH
jgi:hypothetical protein